MARIPATEPQIREALGHNRGGVQVVIVRKRGTVLRYPSGPRPSPQIFGHVSDYTFDTETGVIYDRGAPVPSRWKE